MRVSVVSCGIGDVRSVVNAFIRVGPESWVAHAYELIGQKSGRIIVSGVGAIGDGLAKLRSEGSTRLWQVAFGKTESPSLVSASWSCKSRLRTTLRSLAISGVSDGSPGNVGRITPYDSDICVPPRRIKYGARYISRIIRSGDMSRDERIEIGPCENRWLSTFGSTMCLAAKTGSTRLPTTSVARACGCARRRRRA